MIFITKSYSICSNKCSLPYRKKNFYKGIIKPQNIYYFRSLTKLRDEQKRLYFNQQELARKRHELEYQYRKEKAATVIQGAYRRYRSRGNHHGQQSHQESEQQQGCQPEEQEDQTEEHEQKQQQEHE